MNNLFKKLFTKQQETTPCKALLELDAIRQRNEQRLAKIKEEMGEKWILHKSNTRGKLDEPRPV